MGFTPSPSGTAQEDKGYLYCLLPAFQAGFSETWVMMNPVTLYTAQGTGITGMKKVYEHTHIEREKSGDPVGGVLFPWV